MEPNLNQLILNLIANNPNDAELGRKIRELFQQNSVNPFKWESLNTTKYFPKGEPYPKQILKD